MFFRKLPTGDSEIFVCCGLDLFRSGIGDTTLIKVSWFFTWLKGHNEDSSTFARGIKGKPWSELASNDGCAIGLVGRTPSWAHDGVRLWNHWCHALQHTGHYDAKPPCNKLNTHCKEHQSFQNILFNVRCSVCSWRWRFMILNICTHRMKWSSRRGVASIVRSTMCSDSNLSSMCFTLYFHERKMVCEVVHHLGPRGISFFNQSQTLSSELVVLLVQHFPCFPKFSCASLERQCLPACTQE